MFSLSSQKTGTVDPYLQFRPKTAIPHDVKGMAKFYITHKLKADTPQEAIGQYLIQQAKQLKGGYPDYLFHLFNGLARKGLLNLHDGDKHLLKKLN